MSRTLEKTACAIITDDSRQRVVLIKREDFRIWVLPAGGVDGDESWEDAAIREAREETGLDIALETLVGEYTRPQFDDVVHVYLAHPIGGSMAEHGWEAVDVRWFPLDALPRSLPFMHRAYLADWKAGSLPVRRTQHMPWRFVIMVRVLVFFRNIRNRVMGLP